MSEGETLEAGCLAVHDFGAFLGLHSERVQVRKGKEVQREVPLLHLQHILIVAGGVTLSSDVISACVERGIQITFLTFGGRPYAHIVSPALSGTIRTRREQLLAYNDRRGVALATAFAMGKLNSQANQLRYMAKYRKTVDDLRSRLWLFNSVPAYVAETGDDSAGDEDDDERRRPAGKGFHGWNLLRTRFRSG